MQRCPEAFAHIRSEEIVNHNNATPLRNILPTLKTLSTLIPHCHWLYRNGYGGLYQAPRPSRGISPRLRENRKAAPQNDPKTGCVSLRLADEHGGSGSNG